MSETIDKAVEAATEKVTINVSGQSVTLYKGAIALLVLLVIGLAGWIVWKDYFRPVERAGQTVTATAAAEVVNLPTVAAPIAGGAVQAYPDAVKKKLNLSKVVADNPKKKVVSASKVQASDRPHTVTTLIDTDTGRAETYVRADPLPAFALRSSGAFGVGAGIKRGGPVTEIYIRQDFLQVKAAVLTGRLFANQQLNGGKPDAGAMINVEYRW
jgi:hypothetical protein